MQFDFSLITGKIIHEIIERNIQEIFGVVKSTYMEHFLDKTVNPNSYFLNFPDRPCDRIIALPAALMGDSPVSGIKWISSYPANICQGFPRASAVIILNDYQTGYPFACLEGSIISATRTACSAVLAAEALHSPEKRCQTVGFIGNGLIARYIYHYFYKREWEFKKIILFDEDINSSHKLQKTIQKNHFLGVNIVQNSEELLQECDLIVLATTTAIPYINDPCLFQRGQTILNISLRDLGPEILVNANNVVDDVAHVLSANTSLDLTYKKYKNSNFINGTLGQFLSVPYELDKSKYTIFSPMGLGILDIAIGYFIYLETLPKRNLTRGEVLVINDFFYDLER